jgi:hypothetical protein
MPDAPSGTSPFPVVCPKCGAVEGYPVGAASVPGKPDTVRLTMRCRACQHEWTYETPTTP